MAVKSRKGVVGKPGTITPITPRARDNVPNEKYSAFINFVFMLRGSTLPILEKNFYNDTDKLG